MYTGIERRSFGLLTDAEREQFHQAHKNYVPPRVNWTRWCMFWFILSVWFGLATWKLAEVVMWVLRRMI